MLINYDTGAAYEYTAAAFMARAGGPGDPGTILLNNTNYDSCYQYLYGQITPAGQTITGGADVLQNRLALASCYQDLRQDYNIYITKLNFEIWNIAETKFGGSSIWDCADSWHETILGIQPGIWKSSNMDTFNNLAGPLVYRVSMASPTQCGTAYPTGWLRTGATVLPAPLTGLIGIQSTTLAVTNVAGDGSIQAVGTNLNGKGARTNGQILFNTAANRSRRTTLPSAIRMGLVGSVGGGAHQPLFFALERITTPRARGGG